MIGPVSQISRAQLAKELEQIAGMVGKGEIGTTLASRERIAALTRRAAKIVRHSKVKAKRNYVQKIGIPA
ncbi:RNA polymerase sigma factor RpoD [Ahrensia sp. R2A130]|nr:RNA polymerase sigma factor RpoD [Ahrensia sp. R2A130]